MESKKEFIINTLFYLLIIGLVYFFCNYLLDIFLPFLLGFVFAYIAVKTSKKLTKKDNKITRIVSLIFVYLIIIGIISLLIALGVNEILEFIGELPGLYKQYVEPVLKNLSGNIKVDNNLPIEIQTDIKDVINSLLNSIKTLVSSISSTIVSAGTSLISNTTNLLIGVIAMLITSFFVVGDYENIINYLESLMSPRIKSIYDEVTDFLINTVFLVIKSYGLIMFVTFVELFFGLLIIGVDNFALVSMIIAFLDILPVLGVGTVLIPWGIFELIIGETATGIMLLVLYTIITVIRNIIEPKIVGGNLGLHPLAALFSMLVGVKLLGAIGMFGLPLLFSFFVKRKEYTKQSQV